MLDPKNLAKVNELALNLFKSGRAKDRMEAYKLAVEIIEGSPKPPVYIADDSKDEK